METPIQQWYAGRSVFVTGGTGFMGKVLLEKMLRCLPSLKNLYILLRAKKGVSPKERVEQIYKLPVFDLLRKQCPEAYKKLVVVEGDLSQENLGLSEEDRRIMEEEVSVVMHMAATLKLEAGLKEAVTINTIGTKRVMELASKMKKLEALIHLSTAFCHCDVPELEEKIYPPTKEPYAVMEIIKRNSEESLKKLEANIIRPFPNTYTFTKRLAETVAYEMAVEDNIPLVIARPSIVIPSLREPAPGWVDSLNGPIGVLVAAGKGVLRSMLVEPDNHAEVIPVDIAINGMISLAWSKATKKTDEPGIYNITQSQEILDITWSEVLDRGKKLIMDNPFEWMLWYPDGDIRTNRTIHNIIVFLFQVIPAYFIDFIFWCLRMPRFMVRVQEKIKFGMVLLEYFTLRHWKFRNSKALGISKNMNPEDLEVFYMANVDFDVDEYLKMAILGARTYCCKENPNSLPFWRKVLKFLYVLDRVVKAAILYGLIYFIFSLFGFGHLLSLAYWTKGSELMGHKTM